MNTRHLRIVALGAVAALALAGCTAANTDDSNVTLSYSLWDPNQLPAYQACIDAFTEESGIKVDIQQQGWDDYWKGITTGLVSGTAPDVITNHVAYYPELADNGQLLDLQKYVDDAGIDLDQYTGGLADLWVKDGARYGLPQDWDTIALVYNTSDVKDAGIDAATLNDLTWNPEDGGTFGDVIARLSVDKNGVHGNEPGFDKRNVATYGWGLETGGGIVGQTQWSWTALSTGFKYLEANPFGTDYQLDDPRLAATLTWWQDQIKAGYVVPFEEAGQLGLEPQLLQNKAAMISDGSWRIGTWAGAKEQSFAFAKLPVGPEGRKTIINGLAPSITSGTDHPDEAWELVKFIGSPTCQNIVGKSGVVFPAIASAAEASAAARKADGIDVSAFLDEALDAQGTDYYPITLHANEVNSLAQATIDDIQQGKADPRTALKELDTQVDAVFK
ncbi:MAG: ABC transporter substrate-binding protein [Microbacteriaceae bacterium]